MAKGLLMIADGTEEMEAIITADVLRRADWHIDICSLDNTTIVASRKIKIVADISLNEANCNDYEIIILPGGAKGVENFIKSKMLMQIVKEMFEKKLYIAAICAAPMVLKEAGILAGKKFTCHPSVIQQILPFVPLKERVVVDGKVITAQGPGVSFEFALKIVEVIDGIEKSKKLAQELLLKE